MSQLPSHIVRRLTAGDRRLPQPLAQRHGFEPVIIAIPVRNEEDRIATCLTDLTAQTVRPDAIVCLMNNCTDATMPVAAGIANQAPLPVHLITRHLSATRANAGFARRLAMALAARLAGNDGVLLTTDADTRIAPGWIERNLMALGAGADAVCGQAVIDPVEARAIPAHLHADDALECRFSALLDTLAAWLDPDPADPVPRHTQESGASIAVRVAAFRAVGGIPRVTLGEDRAFIEALRRHDKRIRHAPDISIVVSGRTEGRAAGGMADTMRRRLRQQDIYIDSLLEPAADAYRRVHFRARLRAAWHARVAPHDLIGDLHLPPQMVRHALSMPYFGAAWAMIESQCKLIRRRPVTFADLPRQIIAAERLLAALAQDRAPQAGELTQAMRRVVGELLP